MNHRLRMARKRLSVLWEQSERLRARTARYKYSEDWANVRFCSVYRTWKAMDRKRGAR